MICYVPLRRLCTVAREVEMARGWLTVWRTFFAVAAAVWIVAGNGFSAPAVAAPPMPLPAPRPIPRSSAHPSPAPARSSIDPTTVLTLYANRTADDMGADPGDCPTPTNTDCSLRAAVELANANPGSTVNV